VQEEVVMVISMVLFVVGGVALMIAAMHNRRKVREMAHRERLAMIERGLIPSPESDPARFEAAAGLETASIGRPSPSSRYRTIGIELIGLGVGLAFLIGVAGGSAEIGLGIGGAIAALGAASVLNYYLMAHDRG
jgi:hypothetical protein